MVTVGGGGLGMLVIVKALFIFVVSVLEGSLEAKWKKARKGIFTIGAKYTSGDGGPFFLFFSSPSYLSGSVVILPAPARPILHQGCGVRDPIRDR